MKKIPDHATRVYEGIFLEVWHWDQIMFDGSVKTFEAIRRKSSTEVIATNGDTVYFAEQEQPGRPAFKSLFGGQIEPGEEPLASAKRELLEESGMESNDWVLLSTEQFPWSKLEWETHIYVARNVTVVAEQKLDAGEKVSIQSGSIDEFLQLLLTEIHWSCPRWLYNRTPNSDGMARLTAALRG